jgi:choline dehydrogenase-like flavoprotein
VAIRLKPADVALAGLGGAGGVVVLPLARAGLQIAAIEAGGWLNPQKDYHPDEIHNNVRMLVTASAKTKNEIPTFRTSPSARAERATSGRTMMTPSAARPFTTTATAGASRPGTSASARKCCDGTERMRFLKRARSKTGPSLMTTRNPTTT